MSITGDRSSGAAAGSAEPCATTLAFDVRRGVHPCAPVPLTWTRPRTAAAHRLWVSGQTGIPSAMSDIAGREYAARMLLPPPAGSIACTRRVGTHLDLKAFAVTFGLVFLAELGDKTQLTTMMLASRTRAPWLIFVAAGLALVLSSLIGALFGEALGRVVPVRVIQIGAGAAFVLIGALLLARAA